MALCVHGNGVACGYCANASLSQELARSRVDALLCALAAERAAHAETRAEVERLWAAMARIDGVLGDEGCSCDCGHYYEEHDDDCFRCFACCIEAAKEGA